MPNATCFLIAYALVFALEIVRCRPFSAPWERWLRIGVVTLATLAIFTHSLYLLDRVFLGFSNRQTLAVISWHDWGVFASWAIAAVYGFLLLRRGDSRVGVFVLPTVLLLVACSIALPPTIAVESHNSATGWRFAHSVGMTVGTVLVSLGFAMGVMYFLHAWRLKNKRRLSSRLPLPSLEYLQTSGRVCLLGSAASIGFGMVAGVVMNLTRDGSVEWLDRGILFSGGLFLWLAFASATQWFLHRRGSGQAIALMNILSFAIVAIAVVLVLSTPHGGNRPNESQDRLESSDSYSTGESP